MPRSRSVLNLLAFAYALLVGLMALWAWWVNIRLLYSEHEHLLPALLLFLGSMPSSLTLELVYQRWPNFFNGLWQLAYLTSCAVFQSSVLFFISKWWERRSDA